MTLSLNTQTAIFLQNLMYKPRSSASDGALGFLPRELFERIVWHCDERSCYRLNSYWYGKTIEICNRKGVLTLGLFKEVLKDPQEILSNSLVLCCSLNAVRKTLICLKSVFIEHIKNSDGKYKCLLAKALDQPFVPEVLKDTVIIADLLHEVEQPERIPDHEKERHFKNIAELLSLKGYYKQAIMAAKLIPLIDRQDFVIRTICQDCLSKGDLNQAFKAAQRISHDAIRICAMNDIHLKTQLDYQLCLKPKQDF
jgi:hypothetical protein